MRRILIGLMAGATLFVASGPAAAKSSNPDCIAEDIATIRENFGGRTVGALFSELGGMGMVGETITEFRETNCD